MIGESHDDYTPLLRIDGYLYHQRLFAVESRLARHVCTRLDLRVALNLSISAARAMSSLGLL